MEFDFETLAVGDRYKILTSTIVPRPIAWITTLSREGVRNAAPFSFFNAMGKDPPVLVVGIQPNSDGSMKDTARNILDTGEFVVNLVPQSAAQAMNLTSVEAAPDVDELKLAELDTVASLKVKPPRIAVSPVAFECRLHTPVQLGHNQLIAIGEVVQAFVADEMLADPARTYIDTPGLDLVGRMHGRDWYARTDSLYQIARPAPLAGKT